MNTCAPVSAANDEARPEHCARTRRASALAEINRHHVLLRQNVRHAKNVRHEPSKSFLHIFRQLEPAFEKL